MRHRGHLIANPGVAIAVVQAERRRSEDGSDLNAAQLAAIGKVVRADRRRFRHPTRDQLLDQLYAIAHGDDAA